MSGPAGRYAAAMQGVAPAALALALVLAGCASAAPLPSAGSPSASSGTAAPTDPSGPTDAATPAPGSSGDLGASASAGPAAACTGSDRNRDFWAAVAAAVTWDAWCAVLPAGWYVEAGQYRLAGGGRLEITYRGPGGATLAVAEGAFCPGVDGCVPDGEEAGPAALGGLEGTLVRLDDGGFAVVVARGAAISWLVTGRGLDEASFLALAAAFAPVEG